MSKLKKMKTKLSIAIGVIVLLAVVAISVSVGQAYYGSAPKVVVEGNYIEAQQPIDAQQQAGVMVLGQAYDESYTNFDKLNVSQKFNTAESYDPFMAGNTSLTIATGTMQTIYTATADAMCVGRDGFIFATSTQTFTPGIILSMGTSTVTTGYSTSLLASTTIATSTAQRVIPLGFAADFILRSGESITASFSDQTTGTTASSTNFSGISVTPGISCNLLGK